MGMKNYQFDAIRRLFMTPTPVEPEEETTPNSRYMKSTPGYFGGRNYYLIGVCFKAVIELHKDERIVWCAINWTQAESVFREFLNGIGTEKSDFLRKNGDIIYNPLIHKLEINFNSLTKSMLGVNQGGIVSFECPSDYPKRPGQAIYKGTVDRDTGHFFFTDNRFKTEEGVVGKTEPYSTEEPE